MSFMKMIIISTVISIPFMFLFPSDRDISNIAAQNGINVSNSGMDSQKILAEIQFNDVCGNALLQDCPLNLFKPVYSQCIELYGNLTLEQCRSKCCNFNQAASSNSPDFMGVSFPEIK